MGGLSKPDSRHPLIEVENLSHKTGSADKREFAWTAAIEASAVKIGEMGDDFFYRVNLPRQSGTGVFWWGTGL
ncbi:MAG: hypothetical protein V1789_03405 [PVC group bacterium]